jgi:hypothetical protein
MRIGEIVCRQAVSVGEAVQVGHRGIRDDVGVIGVFLGDNEDVAKVDALTGRRRGIVLCNRLGLRRRTQAQAIETGRQTD